MTGAGADGEIWKAPKAVALTADQAAALDMARAVFASPETTCLIVRGGAGTGKTTLLRAIHDAAQQSGARVAVAAPTGRAARVIERRTGLRAGTIHGLIYRYVTTVVANDDVTVLFDLRSAADDAPDILIIDEASMVGERRGAASYLQFGSDALLPDLVKYLQRRHASHRQPTVVFVGDPAQLPPVGETTSPALDPASLEALGLVVRSADLDEIVRHAAGSDILNVATELRRAIEAEEYGRLELPVSGDVFRLDAADVVAKYVAKFNDLGGREVILIASTNAEVREWNVAIRQVIHGTEAPLVEGDRLIVVENDNRTGYRNGDFLVVDDVGATETVALRDVRVILRAAVVHPDDPTPGLEGPQSVLLVESVLTSSDRSLTDDQRQALLVDFRLRHQSLQENGAEFNQVLRGDARFNALRVKHGYAVTCHKAQGGEWRHAMVAFPPATELRSANGFRWVYTALTRGKSSIDHINAPVFRPSDRMRTVEVIATADVVKQRVQQQLFAVGFEHDLIRKMAYGLRLHVRASERTAEIDVHFNGKQHITNVTVRGGDPEIGDQARAALLPREENVNLSSEVAAAVDAAVRTFANAGIPVVKRMHEHHVRLLGVEPSRDLCSIYYRGTGAVSGLKPGADVPLELSLQLQAAVRSAIDQT